MSSIVGFLLLTLLLCQVGAEAATCYHHIAELGSHDTRFYGVEAWLKTHPVRITDIIHHADHVWTGTWRHTIHIFHEC